MENEEMYELASKLLKMSVENLEKNHKNLDNDNAIYFYSPIRGGGAVIIGYDGSYLFASSAINFDVHLKEYQQGRRNNR